MENVVLTIEEEMKLGENGFYIKKNYSIYDYFIHIRYLTILFSVLIIPTFWIFILIFPILISIFPIFESTFGLAIGTFISTWIVTSHAIVDYIKHYCKSWATFFTKKWIIEYWEFETNTKIPPKILILERFIEKMETDKSYGGKWERLIFYYIVPLFIFFLLPLSLYTNNQFEIIILWLMLIWIYTWIFLIFFVSLLVSQKIYQSFHPLYTFGNLWEKIQNLTPQIEEQSKKIQSEFQSDMNFSVLRDGFDSLSTTFSEIVSLVIKLEKVEARANKWNLFDSEKYINSLRSDIITPLWSLREFLENQKNTLLESRKELMQVRVWRSESTGNIELQSKRSESLIQELTENIEKLDVMIGKIG